MFANDHDLSDALRAGLRSSVISRSQANVAEFCLLTGAHPLEARVHHADNNLPGAVASFLAGTTRVSRLAKLVKCVEAKLFPSPSGPREIQKVLVWCSTGNTSEYAEAEKKYLVDLFRKEILCSDDQSASEFLEGSEWVMEDAVRAYRD